MSNEESSEQEEQEQREEKKLKIVVRLPDENCKRLMAFPFLHALYKLYPDAQYHFFTLAAQKEIFTLLPFDAYIHDVEEIECEKAMETFRLARANQHMHSIDLYFGLGDRFHDSFFGFSITAKKRYGFAEDMKKMMYTRNTPWVAHNHPASNYLKLLSLHTNKNYYDFPDIYSKEFEPLIADKEKPYLVVNLSLDDNGDIDQRWEEFLSLLKGNRVFTFLEELESEEALKKMRETFEKWEFAHTAPLGLEHPFQVARLLYEAQMFVSFDSYLLQMAAYLAVPSIALYKADCVQFRSPLYFGGKVTVVPYEDKSEVDLGKLFDSYLPSYFNDQSSSEN